MEERRDVIEYPIIDDIDLNGWDVRKALRLFWKSNPAFVEWIQSPIIYIESGDFAQTARSLLPTIYSNQRGIYHYLSMAKTNYRGYLKAESVPLKKYFYASRPLLSVRWIERYGSPAPIEFENLLHLIDDRSHLLADIEELLIKKREAPELGLSEQIFSINNFLIEELQRLKTINPSRSKLPSDVLAGLNQLFHTTLHEEH